MEDIENKLNSNNPILVAQVISKILQNIKVKSKTDASQIPETKFLKEKCICSDPLISDVACTAILDLVKDGHLEIESTLADFITMIPVTKCYSSLTSIIGNLLFLQLESKLKCRTVDKNLYNLYSPQHPFVTLLNENVKTHYSLYNEITYFYAKNESLASYATEIFKPVFLFSFCNPTINHLGLFKKRLWTYLLEHDDTIILEILCWMQVSNKNEIEFNSELLNEALKGFIETNSPHTEILILLQISYLYNLTLNNCDIRSTLNCLQEVLRKVPNLITINCLLLIVSKTITLCSPVHLAELLKLCQILIQYDGIETYALDIFNASLLHWVGSPFVLTKQANVIAMDILNIIKTKEPKTRENKLESFSEQYKLAILTNQDVYTTLNLCLLLYKNNQILEWLEKIELTPPFFTKNIFYVLCGIFLGKHSNPKVALKSFQVILKCAEHYSQLTYVTLTLILYKLANTRDSELHFELLKSLPKMIVLRDNIPKVMATINALSKGSSMLNTFSIGLTFEAWKIDNKCYTYLENMLCNKFEAKEIWESNVTKAYVIKQLCERKPELYGNEMVAHLSKILNQSNNINGALPCALAMEGITTLCKAEVIDVVTTWATLSPKFKDDTRVPVIKSLCSLIHEIPHIPYTEGLSDLNEEVITTLWNYAMSNMDEEIVEAGLNALTSFSLEQISMHIPEIFLEEKANQNNDVTEPHLHAVPGQTWIKFLSTSKFTNAASKFLIKMVSIEVANYFKYVYQVKGAREPENYANLPTHSIVRGIGEYIKTHATKWKNNKNNIYVECIKILSQEYSKPLPPLNWCFLVEVIYEPEVKYYCIDLACHQVVLSGSARRLVENFIESVTNNLQSTDVISVYKNLEILTKSIQPVVLKPFFEASVAYAIHEFNQNNEELLIRILDFLVTVLRNESIQETNKNTIAQVLSEIILVTEVSSQLFTILLRCVPFLPKPSIKAITKVNNEVPEAHFEKINKIRCAVAISMKTAPFDWLNDVLEADSVRRKPSCNFTDFIKVLKTHINNTESALWLLELFGQIQAKVADRCDEKEITYFCDVLILAVVVFSGYFVFMENTEDLDMAKKLFSQSLATLLDCDHWSICTIQALEWLYHMNSEEIIPKKYQILFGQALCCMRHDEEFVKNLRWMKYLNCKLYQ